MSPQHHLYNGLARHADYSIFARQWTCPVGTGMDSPARHRGWPTASMSRPAGRGRC